MSSASVIPITAENRIVLITDLQSEFFLSLGALFTYGVDQKEGRKTMKKSTLMCLMAVYIVIDTFWNGYPSLWKVACEMAVMAWLFVGTLKEVSNG